MQFVRARWFANASRGPGRIDRIVWHTMEAPEDSKTAENVANFFSNVGPSNKVSAHYCIDNNSIVMCVRDKNVAFHAAGDNLHTLGFELAGRARQNFKEWRDDYSDDVLELSCKLAAEKCKKYDIPVRWLNDRQLRRQEKGFVTHDAVSRVFGDDIRDDPGERFPYTKAEERTKFYMNEGELVDQWRINFATSEKDKDGNWVRKDVTTNNVAAWIRDHPGALQRAIVRVFPVRD